MARQAGESRVRTLAELWQWPLLLVSVGLLLVGWRLAMPREHASMAPAAIEQARTLILANRYADALDMLNSVQSEITSKRLNHQVTAYWYLLRGDAIYKGLRTRGWDRPLGTKAVITSYNTAEQLGVPLDRHRLQRLAESLIQIGQLKRAEALLSRLGEPSDPLRQQLERRIIESVVQQRRGDPKEVQKILDEYIARKALRQEDRTWAVARYAEVLLGAKAYGKALDKLQLYRARLSSGHQGLGELFLLEGRAYLGLGDLQKADQSFLQADRDLPASDPLRGQVLVGQGRVALARGNVIEALEHYSEAVKGFPTTAAQLPALVGKAECESRRGAVKQSLADYDAAVALVLQRGQGATADRSLLIRSLRAQQDYRRTRKEYDALRALLELEKKLYGTDYPPALLQAMAAAYEHQACQLLGVQTSAEAGHVDRQTLTPAVRKQVGQVYATAAEYYKRHAEAVATEDEQAFRESLWRSADCYDKAGLYRQAIQGFETFIEQLPDDPWQLKASFRLGQACQADGQFDRAIGIYTRLTEQHPKSAEAYSSLVPLARCYMALGVQRFGDAEQVLRSVVTNHPALGPDSIEYQQALIELGRLYYSRGEEGDYEKAIACLTEAVDRYTDHPNRAALWFQLGDAYRKSVDQIKLKLTQPLAPSQKLDLQAARVDRLDAALKCFDRVIQLYDRSSRPLDTLQQLYLRNSYFYRADCAYDLGRYEGPRGAIALYQQAVSRYEKDPSVLVALIQIVNSYCEMGQYDKARAANEQAKWHLRRIPDQAFDDPNLPMSREHWERWLDWRDTLDLQASADAGP